VALVLTVAIFCLVPYLAITRRDVQGVAAVTRGGEERRLRAIEPAPDSLD
jgi:hypothetical protein